MLEQRAEPMCASCIHRRKMLILVLIHLTDLKGIRETAAAAILMVAPMFAHH